MHGMLHFKTRQYEIFMCKNRSHIIFSLNRAIIKMEIIIYAKVPCRQWVYSTNYLSAYYFVLYSMHFSHKRLFI